MSFAPRPPPAWYHISASSAAGFRAASRVRVSASVSASGSAATRRNKGIAPYGLPRLIWKRAHAFEAIYASFATVFMLRAVPVLAAGILSFERPIPLG